MTDSASSYEDFYKEHAAAFASYLTRLLGAQHEGRGGRISVEDTLQEAMLRIARDWPDLQAVAEPERDRRLYRCLRDAAGEALRREHGRLDARRERPRIIAYDFGSLEAGDELPACERELTTSVVGAMARDLTLAAADADRRLVLDRAVLLAGLRALSEREAVVLIAVDHLGWEQDDLAEHLDIGFGALRSALFEARRVFYGIVRHAAGLEVDETERAQLHAYFAGDLAGRERRLARRHIQNCQGCGRLKRELDRFGEQGQRLLAPLPFVAGGDALARRASVKAGAVGGAGGGHGLLSQAGATKALAATVGLLGAGFGVSSWLAERTPAGDAGRSAPRAAFSADPLTRPPEGMATPPAGGSSKQPDKAAGSRPARRPDHAVRHPAERPSRRPATRPPSTATSSAGSSDAAPSARSSAQAGPVASPSATPKPAAAQPSTGTASGGANSKGGSGEFFGQ